MGNLLRDGLKLRHLVTFLALDEEGSITAAAQRLNTVQPAVSRTLRELEAVIGAPLFERNRSGLSRTEAGERLYPAVRNALVTLEEGLARASGLENAVEVRVGALPIGMRHLLPPAIAALKRERPDTRVAVISGSNHGLLEQLAQGDLDMVVGRIAMPRLLRGLVFHQLWDEPMAAMVSAGHPLTKATEVSLAQIDEFPVMLPNRSTIVRDEIDRHLLSRGWAGFRNVVESVSVEFGLAYMRAAQAVMLFPIGALSSEIARGEIAVLPAGFDGVRAAVGISLRDETRLSEPARRLRRLLQDFGGA